MDGDLNIAEEQAEEIGCKNCGRLEVEEGYGLELCMECRDSLSRRPVPLWIKIVSGVVVAIMIFALIKFPSSIGAGIEFEKGIKAEKERKYVTALNHYERAAEKYPDSALVLARLFIAYTYNERPEDASAVFDAIQDEKTSDEELIGQVGEAVDYMNSLYGVSEELYGIIGGNDDLQDLNGKLGAYTLNNPSDPLGFVYLGNVLFDMEMYPESKDAYEKAVKLDPNLYMLKLNIAAAYRQMGDFDRAVGLCNEVLEKNVESPSAHSSLSKIELKRHNYAKALELAQKAYGYDRHNLSVVDNLAVAYHYNNMFKERDEMFDILKQNNYYELERVQSIFDGSLKIYE